MTTTSEVLQNAVNYYAWLYGISHKDVRRMIRQDLLLHLDIRNTDKRLNSLESEIINNK
jgi:hypothetical protein